MKALLSSALLLWFFGVLFMLNKAQTNYCDVDAKVIGPFEASAGLPIISFEHYSHYPDTSSAFHLLRDSLLGTMQPTDRLEVIANYTETEAEIDRNIGLKRANAIRMLFEGYDGFERIEIDSRMSKTVSAPIDFKLYSDRSTQNARDTPIPLMLDEKEEIAMLADDDDLEILVPSIEQTSKSDIEEEEASIPPTTATKEKTNSENSTAAAADYVIYFKDATSRMINEGEVQKYIDELSKRVKVSKENIEIVGYDDNTRSINESLDLAYRRAYRVRKAFADNYVRRKLVQIKNEGQSNPQNTNKTPEGRSKNRRVEIRITKK